MPCGGCSPVLRIVNAHGGGCGQFQEQLLESAVLQVFACRALELPFALKLDERCSCFAGKHIHAFGARAACKQRGGLLGRNAQLLREPVEQLAANPVFRAFLVFRAHACGSIRFTHAFRRSRPGDRPQSLLVHPFLLPRAFWARGAPLRPAPAKNKSGALLQRAVRGGAFAHGSTVCSLSEQMFFFNGAFSASIVQRR